MTHEDRIAVIQAGINYSYKNCCINNYVNLLGLGYYPGVFMEVVMEHDYWAVDHVLCPICYDKYDKRYPNRSKTPADYWGKGPDVDKVFNEYRELKNIIVS